MRTLNVPMDDSEFERISSVKEGLDMNWVEFLLEATDEMVSKYENELPSDVTEVS